MVQRLTDREKMLMWARIINAAREVVRYAGDREIRITMVIEDDEEEHDGERN